MDTAAFNRARSTNRPGTFLDGRRGSTREARRWRDLFQALGEAAGGLERLSSIEVLDVRRAATLARPVGAGRWRGPVGSGSLPLQTSLI